MRQDLALCASKFPDLVCRPTGAQFRSSDVIVLFEFRETDQGIRVASEKHYRLVAPSEFDVDDIDAYRRLNPDD